MLRTLICISVITAFTNAEYHGLIRCNETQNRLRWSDQPRPDHANLNDFNDKIGLTMSKYLKRHHKPHTLIFDCQLAKTAGRDLGLENAFNWVFHGYNKTDLESQYLVAAEKLSEKMKNPWWGCLVSCVGYKPKESAFFFGCDYKVLDAYDYEMRCIFEKANVVERLERYLP